MFRKLVTLSQAKRIIQQHFPPKPLEIEKIKLLDAFERILAQDIVSKQNIPPFSRSTVDGYAVRAKDTIGAEENKPARLRIVGLISAGEKPKTMIKQSEAAEIVTGAPIPIGANAVVMLEHADRKNGDLEVFTMVTKSENVMKAGTDIKKGETALERGQMLKSREIGVLAAMGLAEVKVYATPHVAVLSSGAEITEPGRKLQPGKIYDINAYSLSTAVLESGGKPIYLGVFPDSLTEMEKALKNALTSANVIVTSGGVSVGPKDVMPRVLNSLGKPGIIVCGIAIKPGKPVTIASAAGKPVFSLPGHPASALLVFHLLVRPLIQAMSGRKPTEPLEVEALAGMRMFPAKGRRTFVMVKLKRDKSSRLVAEPVSAGVSGAITTLAKADGFVEIGENKQFVEAKEEVRVQLFDEDMPQLHENIFPQHFLREKNA
jgi:putative molybdopterin biosynthesis protein